MRVAIAESDLKATRSSWGDNTEPPTNELTFSLVITPGQLANMPPALPDARGFRGRSGADRDDKDKGARENLCDSFDWQMRDSADRYVDAGCN